MLRILNVKERGCEKPQAHKSQWHIALSNFQGTKKEFYCVTHPLNLRKCLLSHTLLEVRKGRKWMMDEGRLKPSQGHTFDCYQQKFNLNWFFFKFEKCKNLSTALSFLQHTWWDMSMCMCIREIIGSLRTYLYLFLHTYYMHKQNYLTLWKFYVKLNSQNQIWATTFRELSFEKPILNPSVR